MNITTYRVPQLMSKRITVICVDGIPICTVRGKKSCSDIIAKLQGYDVKVIDGRIDKLIEQMKKEAKNDSITVNQEITKDATRCNCDYGKQ